ncbi:MAG: hypothetical protein ACRENP_00710 [Longimicrobiales bacterium]
MPDVSLTREELYEQVWSKPMRTLAARYGLSDVGLAKTCRRMRIPVPGRGYWAKRQHEKSVRRIPLPKLPASVGTALREFTIRERTDTPDPEEVATGPIAEQRRFEALEENRIRVADSLSDPHPLVATTIKALRKAKPNYEGYLVPGANGLNVQLTLDGADRAMCILDALLKALDARGFTTTVRPAQREGGDTRTVVRVHGEDVEIAISKRVDVVEVPDPKPATKQRRASLALDSWRRTSAPPSTTTRRELRSSGKYTLRIDHSYLGIRSSWSDGKRQQVAECLNAFAIALVVAAEKLKEQRLEREAREREWKAAEERRLEQQRRREEEEARIRALNDVLSAWRDARDIRQYVSEARAALERAGGGVPSEDIQVWLAWAEEYAARVDPFIPQPNVPEDPGLPRRMYGW